MRYWFSLHELYFRSRCIQVHKSTWIFLSGTEQLGLQCKEILYKSLYLVTSSEIFCHKTITHKCLKLVHFEKNIHAVLIQFTWTFLLRETHRTKVKYYLSVSGCTKSKYIFLSGTEPLKLQCKEILYKWLYLGPQKPSY